MARIRNPAAYAAAIQRRQQQELMMQMALQQQAMQQATEQEQPEIPIEETETQFGAYQTLWGNRQGSKPKPRGENDFPSAFGDLFGGR